MEAASHIVVVHASTNDRNRLIQAKSRGAHIVRAEWITACCAKKDQVAIEEFLWDPDDIICRTASFVSAQALDDTPRRSNAEMSRPSGSTTATKEALKFRVSGLGGDVEAQTIKELKAAGGRVVSPSDEQTLVNYLVCNQVEYEHVYPKDSYEEAVTVFWVKRCLMEYRLLKPSSHPLFRPLPAVKDSKVFSDIVAVISCFNDYEKSTLAQLIREFGGQVQETLTKRNQADQRAVTHVIGGAEGERVTEARRQKFKVVDPSWVIESIINDKIMKEDLFPLKGEAYASYKGRADDLWPDASKSGRNSRLRDSTLGKSSEQEAPETICSDLDWNVQSVYADICCTIAFTSAEVKR
ncbi:BRCA1 protein [Cooperia oncophora]